MDTPDSIDCKGRHLQEPQSNYIRLSWHAGGPVHTDRAESNLHLVYPILARKVPLPAAGTAIPDTESDQHRAGSTAKKRRRSVVQ